MGLFYRRPLCLFCFLFALSALSAWRLLLSWTLPMLIGVGGLAILFAVCAALSSKYRRKWITVVLATLFVFLSLLHLLLRIDLPQRRAGEWTGERKVAVEILEEESFGYRVRIVQIGDEVCGIGGNLYLSSDEPLSVGDRVLATAELRPTTELNRYRAEDGILYSIWVKEESAVLLSHIPEQEEAWKLLGSSTGRHALSSRIRNWVCERLTDRLGEETGRLCGGFLMGDTSLLPDQTVRDFRRTGTSHLMAISGMHIAVLLGSADWLLRRLYVSKKPRCGIISLLAFLFLAITGFAGSACRSVLMLFFVYLSYLFGEENDSVTALFGSVTVILLMFPYALTDLGLWMSFLATLGLLTVYPLLEKKVPRAKRIPLKLLRKSLLILIMTLIANLFLLPVMWAVFGEISWIALLSNLPLSPLADLLLVGVLPFLALGWIPYLGDGFAFLLRNVGTLFVGVLRIFSGVPYSVISLRYDFCNVLIPLFGIAMSTLLILRLKQKRWIALPPAATLLAFFVCFGAYHGTHREPTVTRWESKTQGEMIVAEKGLTMSIYDGSSGDYESYSFANGRLSRGHATEIQTYILHRYGRTEGISLLLRRTMIHELILPTPTNGEEARIAARIFSLAKECGTQVTFQ